MKKRIFAFICILMSILMCLNSNAFAAIYTFETQFEYDSPDEAWLTDLVIKENLSTAEGLASRVNLKALPETPYTETPESFKEEVEKYASVYSLSENSARAGYVYIFEILGNNSELFSLGATDRDVMDYLQGNGISYPSDADSEDRIMARALYVAMMTGSFSLSSVNADGSISLEDTVVAYASQLSGINKSALTDWVPGGEVSGLDDYILAASKLSLWTNGYDVDADTSENEVYRLLAIMTIEKLGISVDRSKSFDELKSLYTAALLGKKYNVTVDSGKLATALNNSGEAFYILQLIGQQKAGMSIRSESTDFASAFYSVAENTDLFDIEDGEFYADISEYEGYLTDKCASVWIYPTAYATADDSAVLTITANGQPIKNNLFTEVSIDASSDVSKVLLHINCVKSGKVYEKDYTLYLYQGKDGEASSTGEAEAESFVTADKIVSDVLDSLGVNTTVSDILDSAYSALPASVKNTLSVIAPTFDDDADTSGVSAENTAGASAEKHSDSYFIELLDKIGAVADWTIKGIGGAGLTEKYESNALPFDYITFD